MAFEGQFGKVSNGTDLGVKTNMLLCPTQPDKD